MLYAKIFTDYESQNNQKPAHLSGVKKPEQYSAQLLTPQSLFCFAHFGMDDYEDLIARRRRLNGNREF